jgi:hypothetical protein
MGQQLPLQEAELYKRCGEVLHYIWDPIGVAGTPGARDEYDAYLPGVFARVLVEANPDEIIEYQTTIEKESMGLPPNPERARAAVDVLVEWREWIWERAA